MHTDAHGGGSIMLWAFSSDGLSNADEELNSSKYCWNLNQKSSSEGGVQFLCIKMNLNQQNRWSLNILKGSSQSL